MAFLEASFTWRLYWAQYLQNRRLNTWYWRFLLRVYLVFRCICPQLYLLRRFVSMTACVIGMALSLRFGVAEYIHTRGMLEQDLSKLQFALKLFPWDFRFRTGIVQVSDIQNNIEALLNVKYYEPNSTSLMIILIRHMISSNDFDGAAKQFKELYNLAPTHVFVKTLLAQQRIP